MTTIKSVLVPVVGYVVVEVKADNDEDAIDQALGGADFDVSAPDSVDEDKPPVCIGEFDVFRVIVEGNVLHTYINKAKVIETWDTDDE